MKTSLSLPGLARLGSHTPVISQAQDHRLECRCQDNEGDCIPCFRLSQHNAVPDQILKPTNQANAMHAPIPNSVPGLAHGVHGQPPRPTTNTDI